MVRETTIRSMWDIVSDLEGDGRSDDGRKDIADLGKTRPSEPRPSDAGREEDAPKRRSGRVKTRLLGVDHSNGSLEEMETMKPTGMLEAMRFPVGWLVVIGGPGAGTSFALGAGVSQIGRGEDQVVSLDFGDTSISREGHAFIAFDEESKGFFIGHGGKANLVRLNGKPVLSTESLSHGDRIRIGETTLMLAALCGEAFLWAPQGDSE